MFGQYKRLRNVYNNEVQIEQKLHKKELLTMKTVIKMF